MPTRKQSVSLSGSPNRMALRTVIANRNIHRRMSVVLATGRRIYQSASTTLHSRQNRRVIRHWVQSVALSFNTKMVGLLGCCTV
jgi:hypothetical protein